MEGFGDRLRLKAELLGKDKKMKDYIQQTMPQIMDKINDIHAAVSCNDLQVLESHINKPDYALAKDHFGMAPLHKAVIMGHLDVVKFLLDRFPETINARDGDGRTALHYAAATNHKHGQKIYKLLLRAGADTKVKDLVSN